MAGAYCRADPVTCNGLVTPDGKVVPETPPDDKVPPETPPDGKVTPGTPTDEQKAAMADGALQLLAVRPTSTVINHHICIVVGGVVPQVAEARLADDIIQKRKTRDEAQADYEAASGSARDGAWNTLQATDTALQKALTAAATKPQPITLSVFLNGKTSSDLTVPAEAKSGPQALLFGLEVPNDAEKAVRPSGANC
ncbi:hypothetical protein [Mesorhizobium huakuii]|uniref:Uncharacterized protein n=1 Tax=Mesorhizobium huakuii TaxID=28104 RepID=A0A7G6SMQ7_9HYPH|nr:hypothetical protein [Mesorhizobium huakuii]QND55789.1 hypothetical protein HB778_03300 [Mesorhizobium huakuii]